MVYLYYEPFLQRHTQGRAKQTEIPPNQTTRILLFVYYGFKSNFVLKNIFFKSVTICQKNYSYNQLR